MIPICIIFRLFNESKSRSKAYALGRLRLLPVLRGLGRYAPSRPLRRARPGPHWASPIAFGDRCAGGQVPFSIRRSPRKRVAQRTPVNGGQVAQNRATVSKRTCPPAAAGGTWAGAGAPTSKPAPLDGEPVSQFVPFLRRLPGG